MGSSMMGVGSGDTQTSVQQVQETRLLNSIGSGRVPGDDAKIRKGAREFEAMLLSSWLQQAEKSFATVPGADDDDSAGKDQMMSLGIQSLAGSMAASGGIGIGAMVASAMERAAEKARPAEAQKIENRGKS